MFCSNKSHWLSFEMFRHLFRLNKKDDNRMCVSKQGEIRCEWKIFVESWLAINSITITIPIKRMTRLEWMTQVHIYTCQNYAQYSQSKIRIFFDRFTPKIIPAHTHTHIMLISFLFFLFVWHQFQMCTK